MDATKKGMPMATLMRAITARNGLVSPDGARLSATAMGECLGLSATANTIASTGTSSTMVCSAHCRFGVYFVET